VAELEAGGEVVPGGEGNREVDVEEEGVEDVEGGNSLRKSKLLKM
jgi:hypothetical protein